MTVNKRKSKDETIKNLQWSLKRKMILRRKKKKIMQLKRSLQLPAEESSKKLINNEFQKDFDDKMDESKSQSSFFD